MLNNRDANGEVFDTFEKAHQASGITLDHRGDCNGNSYYYIKKGPEHFVFYSLGADNLFDTADDLAVEYKNQHWLAYYGPNPQLIEP